MTSFDFDAALRWARFAPRTTLARRADDRLPFVDGTPLGGQGLLLDTCVYIDQMQDRSPPALDDLVARRQVNHSAVVIQELIHSVGVLNPFDARTASVIDKIGKQIKAMPDHRIFAPDTEVLARAALLSGILCRLQGYEKDGKLRALHDCVLFLQARKLGLVVLTANVGDYDILLQLIPDGRALFYRRKQNGRARLYPWEVADGDLRALADSDAPSEAAGFDHEVAPITPLCRLPRRPQSRPLDRLPLQTGDQAEGSRPCRSPARRWSTRASSAHQAFITPYFARLPCKPWPSSLT